MTRAAVCRSGRSVLAAETDTKRVWVGSATATSAFSIERIAARAGRLEGGRAHVPTSLPSPEDFHREDGVAGIDRAPEARRTLDRHDVADLRGIQQRRDARHQVLAEGGRGSEQVRVGAGDRDDLRREHGGEGVLVGRVVDAEDAADACELRRPGRRRAAPSAAHTTIVISAPLRAAARRSRTWRCWD